MNTLKGIDFAKKFLSRKFLLAVAVFLLGLVNTVSPDLPNIIPWTVAGPIIAFIFGEAGRDILRDYIRYKHSQKDQS
jgi:uncharacterized protein YqgC (DUF456 family)